MTKNTVAWRRWASGLLLGGLLLSGYSWASEAAPRLMDPSLALSAAGVPYVAYTDSVNNSRLSVVKFEGGAWVNVGSPAFSPLAAFHPSLALNAAGVPYVAYQDSSRHLKLSVMKFENDAWTYVGEPGFSAGWTPDPSLALDVFGTPFVAYRDFDNGYRLSVVKFEKGAWTHVGSRSLFFVSEACEPSLKLDAAGVPYVAYKDGPHYFAVIKYEGGRWNHVEPADIPSREGNSVSLALDAAGAPYVAYNDGARGYKLSVKKFEKGRWSDVGSPGFSPDQVGESSLALDAAGTPYVVYVDYNSYKDSHYGTRLSAAKFEKGAWVFLGAQGVFSGIGFLGEPSLAITADGVPYVAYSIRDYQDGTHIDKFSVKKFDGKEWVSVGTPTISSKRVVPPLPPRESKN